MTDIPPSDPAPPPAAPSAGAADLPALSLAQYRARQMPPASRSLLAALLQVVGTRLERTQGRVLLQLVGRALAAERPLEPCATLAEIESRATAQLMELGLGWCRMREGDSWIEIVHGELPGFPAAADRLPAVLEGLYEGWLQAAGAEPVLRAVWLRGDAEPVPHGVLRYGHPERLGAERLGAEPPGAEPPGASRDGA